ncbi:MAG: HDOD domain-containing protein [Bdellovibrionales bacterium]|nr:HDOD domain-containing protein [Bdellovibrionales bacterium]
MTGDLHDNQPDHEGLHSKDENKPTGPFGILFPPDMTVWKEARRLVGDPNTRVEDIAVTVGQDPVITIELVKAANAMFFAGGKANITSMKTAIVRLGGDVVLETLEKLQERQQLEDAQQIKWYNIHRNRCKRTAIVAKILAEAVARTLSDDCEAASLLSSIGEMLAVLHLREEYVAIAEENSRSGTNYRLAQNHKFDVERMGLTYLRRQGVPEALVFAIDREARPRSPDRAIMKPVCAAAAEMVDAFDMDRWEKLTPGKTLPPKSSLRMLQMNDQQYLRVYERCSEYLFAMRKKEAGGAAPIEEESPAHVVSDEEQALENEIQNIIHDDGKSEVPSEWSEEQDGIDISSKTVVREVSESIEQRNELFALNRQDQQVKTVARVEKKVPVEPPKMVTPKANKVMSAFTDALESARTSEELLTEILAMLVDNAPFEKSALIVVSKDRKHAIVVAARGPGIGSGQKIALDDPLSPLAKCFSKVQSFGNRGNASSPFNSKAFALAPVDADHDTPVALYADCGAEGSLTFEARRIFRNVVDILNQKLPQIPGGIPVEI